jgi:hypothetical protein
MSNFEKNLKIVPTKIVFDQNCERIENFQSLNFGPAINNVNFNAYYISY